MLLLMISTEAPQLTDEGGFLVGVPHGRVYFKEKLTGGQLAVGPAKTSCLAVKVGGGPL